MTLSFCDLSDIFFDLGNVVVPIDISRLRQSFLALGVPESILTQEFTLEVGEGSLWEQLHTGRCIAREYASTFRRKHPSLTTISDGDFSAAMASILLPTPPARVKLIQHIKAAGVRCHVISNNTEFHAPLLRQEFAALHPGGMESLFDTVLLSHEVGMKKPDPRIYQHALTVSNAVASRSLMIDDLESNLVGARSVGMQTLHLTPADDICDHPLFAGLVDCK